jgi:hypothetical protein
MPRELHTAGNGERQMSDMREIAERAGEILDRRGWTQRILEEGGGTCLGVALRDALAFSREEDDDIFMSGFSEVFAEAASLIREYFPGRSPDGLVIPFNDHPDTTREDVDLILKHMGGS